MKKLVIFWYFSITIGKYTVLQLWRLAGRLFWRPTRRRCAPVWLLINGITSGFVLRPRSILYSRNFASFDHRFDAGQNCTVFYSRPPYRCGAGTTYRLASSYVFVMVTDLLLIDFQLRGAKRRASSFSQRVISFCRVLLQCVTYLCERDHIDSVPGVKKTSTPNQQ